jgi:hypothetical protein
MRYLAVGLLVATLLSVAERAQACSCARLSADELIAAVPIVFEGEVMDIRMIGGNRQITTVRVVRAIKGDVRETVEVATHIESAACGYDFRSQGKRLTVGAFPGRNSALTTTLCTMFLLNQQRL